MMSYEIIKKPVITENSMDQMADRKYTFEVARKATKPEIAEAVEKMFGVEVACVRTINMKKKPKKTPKKRKKPKKKSLNF